MQSYWLCNNNILRNKVKMLHGILTYYTDTAVCLACSTYLNIQTLLVFLSLSAIAIHVMKGFAKLTSQK